MAIQNRVDPIFPGLSNAFVFTLDRGYFPQLVVMMQSVIDNVSPSGNYDFVVFESDFLPEDRRLLQDMCPKNISIRFFDMGAYVSEYFPELKLYSKAHWSTAVWHKCFIPYVFYAYEKVCSLDVDAIVTDDPNIIFQQLDYGMPLMGVKDSMAYQMDQKKNEARKKYTLALGISDTSRYFNGGVILFNIPFFDKEGFMQELLNLFRSGKDLWFLEQDALNLIFQDKSLLMPLRYNFQSFYDKVQEQLLQGQERQEYFHAKENPWFIHFWGNVKPWHSRKIQRDFYDIFWHYAEKSPVGKRLRLKAAIFEGQLEKLTKRKDKFRSAYNREKFLAFLSSGDGKIKHQAKRTRYKKLLLRIENYT